MDHDDAGFLRRWSRRKAAARAGGTAAHESAPAVAGHGGAPSVPQAAVDGAQAAAPLPPVDSLKGLASDYRAFFQDGVDPDVQRAAVKRLFSDPHFNEMDGLDVYIEDYGIADPIPADMLAELTHTQGVLPAETEADADADSEPDLTAGSDPAGSDPAAATADPTVEMGDDASRDGGMALPGDDAEGSLRDAGGAPAGIVADALPVQPVQADAPGRAAPGERRG